MYGTILLGSELSFFGVFVSRDKNGWLAGWKQWFQYCLRYFGGDVKMSVSWKNLLLELAQSYLTAVQAWSQPDHSLLTSSACGDHDQIVPKLFGWSSQQRIIFTKKWHCSLVNPFLIVTASSSCLLAGFHNYWYFFLVFPNPPIWNLRIQAISYSAVF